MPGDRSQPAPPFVSGIQALSRRLGVPLGLVRTHLDDGLIPHLERGGKLLFHVGTVEKALADAAERERARVSQELADAN